LDNLKRKVRLLIRNFSH